MNMNKYLPSILVLSLITCCVEVDISVPSFPDISDYFNISDSYTQMIIAINFLGFCLSAIAYGPLSDSFGRRKIMLIGNGVMAIGAIMCSFANNIELILLGRFIQGIGASTSAVVAFAMIADVFAAKESAKIIGQMNSLITIFMSFAPIAGGFINKYIGWRGNFSTIAVISVISWIVLYLLLPETRNDRQEFKISSILGNFKTLLKDKSFILSSTIPSLQFGAWMSFVSCGPFLYMETYGLTIIQYALHQGSIIAAFSITSLNAGKISAYLGTVNTIKFGLYSMVFSSILMTIVALCFDEAPYFTTLFMVTQSIGVAISYPIIFARSLEIFPEIRGATSSILMSVRSLICAVSILIASYFYSGTLTTIAIFLLLSAILCVYMSKIMLKILSFES